MYISICPTQCKQLASASLIALLLAACATGPMPSTPAPTTIPPRTPSAVQPPAEPPAPSIIIQGRLPQAILDSVVKYRTQKGMRVVERNSSRVVLSIIVPKSNPRIEVRMIFSLSPAPEAPSGLRLSAQVFQISTKDGKTQNEEITPSLRDELNDELTMYARQ